MASSRRTKAKSIAEDAVDVFSVDRDVDYGDPVENHRSIAKMWSVILGTEISARQVAKCMIAVKLVRDGNTELRDNVIDTIGYALIMQFCTDTENDKK
jgi:hypothetical protein